MMPLSDDDLIAELKKRFDFTKQALYDLKIVTRKLEEVNKKLEESEHVKSSFLSNIKNEINNPLTSIQGLAQQLTSSVADDADMVRTIGHLIHAESFNLDFQLRNIFIAAELESGEAELQFSITDVETVISSTIQSFQHLLAEKELTITVERSAESEVHGERLLYKTDSEKFQIIFSNLLSNAISFNRQGGSIEVTLSVLENTLHMTVVDTGIGVDPEHVHLLFDRFRQFETGTTKSYKGHGLGLSITKALLDLMEGTISVASQKEQGTTFSVSLPVVETDMDADAFSLDGNEFLFSSDDSAEVF
ncbi:MAG: HAMP domain-containing histidine kinase [Magnetococcales bacterium]|nr:HAMP domain-containing histidine kinase [Magnetococcales bacterium]NGZ25738.1 HAMP domain-containing histidine kinase [Magnetococcales bacterium]